MANEDTELSAIQSIISSLERLDTGARERVLSYVFQRLGLSATPLTAIAMAPQPVSESTTSPVPQKSNDKDPVVITDIRALREQKSPKTAIQMAVLVAYYISELAPQEEKKGVIDSSDIVKYFKQAAFLLPGGKPANVLTNAKRSGYLDSAGGHGKYKLNPVGYNLAAHNLPQKADVVRTLHIKKSAGKK